MRRSGVGARVVLLTIAGLLPSAPCVTGCGGRAEGAPVAAVPTSRKVDMAMELERAVKARDPRIVGVRTSIWGDGSGEGAVATSTAAGSTTF